MSRVNNAIVVLEPQRSPEWIAARLGCATGSEAKKVIREVPATARDQAIRMALGVKQLTAKVKDSPEYLELINEDPKDLLTRMGLPIPESAERMNYRRTRVAERITGVVAEEKFTTPAMRWGQINEPWAKAKYQLVTGNVVNEAYFLRHPELRCGASPDGNVIDRETGEIGILEIKCLESHNHLYKIIRTQKIPSEFYVQIQMEMWLANVDFGDFVGYDSRMPGKLDIFIKRVRRNDQFIDGVLEPELRIFLDECDKDEREFRALIEAGFDT